MTCQRCQSGRVLHIRGRTGFHCQYGIGVLDTEGPPPPAVSDEEGYLTVQVCLECGQLQGEWPRRHRE